MFDPVGLFKEKVFLGKELHENMLMKSISFADRNKQSIEFYKTNRGVNSSTVKKNTILGKMGEAYVAKFFETRFGLSYLSPDFEIYGPGNRKPKDWSPDLEYRRMGCDCPNIHVKACDNTTSYFLKKNGYIDKYSWTYNIANTNKFGGRDNIFNSFGNDLTAFVHVHNVEKDTALLYAIMDWTRVAAILKPPIYEWLKKIKLCVYANDVDTVFNLGD